MDLLSNPFYILGASTYDNRKRLLEISEEKSLFIDASICAAAKSDLLNPQKRLFAEISWLPGIKPSEVSTIIQSLNDYNLDDGLICKMSSMAKVNYLNSYLINCGFTDSDRISNLMVKIAISYDEIDFQETADLINESREKSGFSAINESTILEPIVNDLRRFYARSIMTALSKLSLISKVKTLTDVVESATNKGTRQNFLILDDVVDAYELGQQNFLEQEVVNIKKIVEQVSNAAKSNVPDSSIEILVQKLIDQVKKWDFYAQPIQISTKSRGLEHTTSASLAYEIRNLAIDLFNSYDKLQLSKKLTTMLSEVFAEVVSIADRTAEDSEALNQINDRRVNEQKLIEEVIGNKVYDVTVTSFGGIVSLNVCPCCLGHADLNQDVSYMWQEGMMRRSRSFSFGLCSVCKKHQSEYLWKKIIITILTISATTVISKLIAVNSNITLGVSCMYSSIVCLCLIFLFSKLLRLRELPLDHACRGKSVKMQSASIAQTTFRFYHPLYAKHFAEGNKSRIVESRVVKPPRGNNILKGSSAFFIIPVATIVTLLMATITYPELQISDNDYTTPEGNSVQPFNSSTYTDAPYTPYNHRSSELSSQIDQGKAYLRILESELESLDSQLRQIQIDIDDKKADVERYERMNIGGLSVDEFTYNSAVNSYNASVNQYNNLLPVRNDKYQEYTDKLDAVNRLVDQYNNGN
ncbi:MAG: hypothetical protein Q8M98_03945 [Candidatus Cloacimonadaceae bacterium]|nr:hypothetical protein [Candidatus Cloacimonadaceae bacterium]